MTLLVVGLVLFLGVHLVPTVPALRARLAGGMGEIPYKIVFSLVSLATFVVLVKGKASAPFVALWQPPAWGRHVTMLLVLLAFIAVVAAYVPCNLHRWLKHPMLVGIKLWALGHLLANGDAASVLLFGGFLAWAVYDRISVKRRGVAPYTRSHSWVMDVVAIAVGVGLYAAVAFNHQMLFGVPAIVRGG